MISDYKELYDLKELDRKKFLELYGLLKEEILSFRKKIKKPNDSNELYLLLKNGYTEASNYDEALSLVKNGTGLDYHEERIGDFPLLICARKNLIKTSALILKAGADVNNKNNYLTTALMVASRHDYLDLVKLLVLMGANVNLKSADGDTALINAKKHGSVDVFKYLIENGAYLEDLNYKNESAITINRDANGSFGITEEESSTLMPDYASLIKNASKELKLIKG